MTYKAEGSGGFSLKWLVLGLLGVSSALPSQSSLNNAGRIGLLAMCEGNADINLRSLRIDQAGHVSLSGERVLVVDVYADGAAIVPQSKHYLGIDEEGSLTVSREFQNGWSVGPNSLQRYGVKTFVYCPNIQERFFDAGTQCASGAEVTLRPVQHYDSRDRYSS